MSKAHSYVEKVDVLRYANGDLELIKLCASSTFYVKLIKIVLDKAADESLWQFVWNECPLEDIIEALLVVQWYPGFSDGLAIGIKQLMMAQQDDKLIKVLEALLVKNPGPLRSSTYIPQHFILLKFFVRRTKNFKRMKCCGISDRDIGVFRTCWF